MKNENENETETETKNETETETKNEKTDVQTWLEDYATKAERYKKMTGIDVQHYRLAHLVYLSIFGADKGGDEI